MFIKYYLVYNIGTNVFPMSILTHIILVYKNIIIHTKYASLQAVIFATSGNVIIYVEKSK